MLVSDLGPEAVEACWMCRESKKEGCHDCGSPFGVLDADGLGYRSFTSHLHAQMIAGIPGTVAINRKLCHTCMEKDRRRMYPDEPVNPGS